MQESSSFQGQDSLPKRRVAIDSTWYKIVVVLILVSAISILIVEDAGPQAYIRYLLASVLVLFLPGYAFLKALSPSRAISRGGGQMDNATRFALSVVLSIVMVSVLSLILDLSPWGINLGSLILSLSVFTFVSSTIGLAREQRDI
jgi:uncharacterized membrane protein